MAFFSMEHTPFKTWLVVYQRWWCLLPLLVFCGIAYLLGLIFKGGSEDFPMLVLTCLSGFAFVLEGLLHTAYKTVQGRTSPFGVYTLIALLPAVGVFLLLTKIYTHPIITTGVLIWLCISIIVGIMPAIVIWKYAYRNFDTQISEMYSRHMGQTEYDDRRRDFAYSRSVETYLITTLCFAVLGVLFL